MQLKRDLIKEQLTIYERKERHCTGKYHERALRLKTFLEKPLGEILTAEQFSDFTIMVCELIDENNSKAQNYQLQLIKNLQSLYPGGNAFFDLFKLFAKMMNSTLCAQLASMNFTEAKLLRGQYKSYFKDIPGFNATLLLAIIATIKFNSPKINTDEPDYFNDLVIWLGGTKPVPPANERLLNVHMLDLLTVHKGQLASLHSVLTLLHNKGCLVDAMGKVNYDYLNSLRDCTDLKALVEILSLGSKRFDADLVRTYCYHTALPTLIKTYNFFNKYPEVLPNQFDILLNLSKQPLVNLLSIVIKLEQLQGIIPVNYLQCAIKAAQNKNLPNVDAYLEFFHTKDLLDPDAFALIAENLINVEVAFQNALSLDFLDLLKHRDLRMIADISCEHLKILTTFKNCVPLIKDKFDQFLTIPKDYLVSFCEIAKMLLKTDEKLASQNISVLFTIKSKYYPQVARLCFDMAHKQLLNDNSLQKIFSVYLKKMDPPSVSPVTITEISEGETVRLKYKKTTGKPIIFGNHSTDKIHSHGIYMEGFQKSGGKNIPWNLKVFTTADNEKLAKKEAKYRKDVFLIQNKEKNQWEILSKTKGMSLQNVMPQQLLNIPFENRLEVLVGLLKELTSWHQMRRMHGNVRLENCIWEPGGAEKYLTLTNYEGASKIKSFFCSDNLPPEYMDKCKPGEEHRHLPREVRATAILIAKLFPEYMAVIRTKSSDDKISLTCTPLDSPQEEPGKLRHTVISLLVADMDSDSRASRCTMALAASYCEQIFAKLSDLDYEQMNVIRNKTLINKSCNEDDIIQDRRIQAP